MEIDSGSTGFIIVCAALVNFMTPGLAFFYGGLVRQQNVLTIIMQNFVAMGFVTIIWVVWGFSLCFGKSGKLFGDPSSYAMLSNIEDLDGNIPGLVFARASSPRPETETPRARRAAPKEHRDSNVLAASLSAASSAARTARASDARGPRRRSPRSSTILLYPHVGFHNSNDASLVRPSDAREVHFFTSAPLFSFGVDSLFSTSDPAVALSPR